MNVFARVLFFVFVCGSLGHAQSPEGSLVGTVAECPGARIIGCHGHGLSQELFAGAFGENRPSWESSPSNRSPPEQI